MYKKMVILLSCFLVLSSLSLFAQDSICTYLWDNCEHDICLDSTTMHGEIIQVPEDVTRISRTGLSMCLEDITTQAATDLIVIMDLSGSMEPQVSDVNGNIGYHISGSQQRLGDTTISYQFGTITIPIVQQLYGNWRAGDPFGQRAIALQAGINEFGNSAFADQSTVGYLGFCGQIYMTGEGSLSGATQYLAPVRLNTQGKTQINSIIDDLELIIDARSDVCGGTNYRLPLDTALTWFSDQNLTPNSKKAIIFFSDGRAKDGAPTAAHYDVLNGNNSTGDTIPVYGIFLGVGGGGEDLLSLSTQERYYEIPYNAPDSLSSVVLEIIGELQADFTAGTVTASNVTNRTTVLSEEVIESSTEAGVFDVTLNGIIPLEKGINDIQVTSIFTSAQGVDTTIGFSFKLDVSGQAASCSTFACNPVSTLEFIDPTDSLTTGDTEYTIRLTTFSTELTTATIVARTGKGDVENIELANPQLQGNKLVFEGTYPFSSGSGNVGQFNGISDADFDDLLTVRWEHPDDPRDTAYAEMIVRVIPDDIEIFDIPGQIPPAEQYDDHPITEICTAGVNQPLTAKLFADGVFQSKFESKDFDQRITWEYVNVETGFLNDTALGNMTPSNGYTVNFYGKQARKEVDVIVYFDKDRSSELKDTVRFYIVPGQPHHLVIEATSDSNSTNLYDDNPLDTIVMDSAQILDSAYAVLRDIEGNYVSPATNAEWGAIDTNVVVTRVGNADQGQGLIDKNTGETDETKVYAISGIFSDSVVVITKAYSIISLRIRVIYNGSPIDIDSLYMRTSSGDTTLIVEGERSDNHNWERVTGEWIIIPISGAADLTDPLPGRTSSWQFEPIDTGSGYIKVIFGSADPDSIKYKFDPGYPTRADFTIISHAPSDSIKAGDTVTAVVQISNNLGPMPGIFCYPGPGGDSAVYQEDLGQGSSTRPEPISIVDSVSGPLNTGNTADQRSQQCFEQGTDTVQFVLYYAPSDPDSLNQLTVQLGQLSASTREFRVYPGDLAKIDIIDKNTNNIVADTVTLNAGQFVIVEIKGYDLYGNFRGCEISDWNVTDSLHPIGRDTVCEIYYEAPLTNVYDKSGNIVVTPLANISLVDSFHVILIAPQALFVDAITRDDNANGYLDGMLLVFSRKISIPDTGNLSVSFMGTSFEVTSIISVSGSDLDSLYYATLKENTTANAQTAWLPSVNLTGHEKVADTTITSSDGAAPVIWKVVKVINNLEDRTKDEVTVTFSENLERALGTRSSHEPQLILYVWHVTDSDTVLVDTLLEGIDFFQTSKNDNQAVFRMSNARDLTTNHLLNVQVGVDKVDVVDNSGNIQDVYLNRLVRVELEGVPLRISAGPNPFPPNSNPALQEENLKSYNSQDAAKMAYYNGGTAIVLDLPLPSNPDNINAMDIQGNLKVYDLVGNLVYSRKSIDNLVLNEWRSSWVGDKKLGFYWSGLNDKGMKTAAGVYKAIIIINLTYIDAYGEEKTEQIVEDMTLGVNRGLDYSRF